MKQIFNKLKWTGKKAYFWYVSRGSAEGEEVASTDDVVEVGSEGVVIRVGSRERYIPYHRIVEIRLESGEVLLNRRK